MTTADASKNLQSLLKKLKVKAEGEAPALPEDKALASKTLLTALVHGFMLWEATTTQAKIAVRKLEEAFVDTNELRIALPHETAKALGDRFPLAAERCLRMKATLQDIYRREHAMSLASLIDLPKRDARAYLDSLEGMPPFVAARLVVFSLGGHAAPVDWRLSDLLIEHRALPADHAEPGSASPWLERQLRAAESFAAATALQAWSDEHGQSPKHDRSAASGPVAMAELAVVSAPAKKAAKKAARKSADRAAGKGKPR